MSNLLSVFVTITLLLLFPVFIFWMFIRAIRIPGTRWWGIVILLSILTCYCTSMTAIAGLLVGGSATGTAALEQRYCGEFRDALTQTESLPAAMERMDAVSASDAYRVREPDNNPRFRYVWLLGGCFLFAIANLMMFGPGRREKRHPADCTVAVLAALVVFLTGIWQIAWGNGYVLQANSYRRDLTDWHDKITLDAIHVPNSEIAAKLHDDDVKSLNRLRLFFLELSGERIPLPGKRKKKQEAAAPGGIAIIGGADGPTAVFIGSELLKKQGGASAENAEKTDSDSQADETSAEGNASN